ncbi:MAG TPA: 2-C-methyl-D-erythritol 4-phosphate cytidylyltransferase [Candidatus Limnocylindria bacterium]|nr:2-C-methyl-D-erythritol 4-phosphate cytidylyltransferase [Candidatus Limnocylindria bacterium]
MSVTALLLCAGEGRRLGAGVAKALAPLAGRPLFLWSLETLQRTGAVHEIVVIGPVKRLQHACAAAAASDAKVVAWAEGGRERQDSVARGLAALPAGCTVVLVHDCARALVSAEVIGRVVADTLAHGAAIASVPLADTLKRATLARIDATVPRSGLWCAQTPQGFRRDWLEAAHAQASVKATDDAALVEALGHPVQLSPGDVRNFKITTPDDLELAEAWLQRTSART